MPSTHTIETATSADGTPIAYERTGNGSPLVLVHGMAGNRKRWELFGVRSALAEHFTVYAVDRRGHGESGDADEYDLDREFEDVAAVVESIDEPVALLGHSHGATCALEGALLTDNVRSLILYEPLVPWEIFEPHIFDKEVVSELEALLDQGENDQALGLFFQEQLGLPSEELEALRSAPNWQDRVDEAHTLPREYRAPSEYEFDAVRFEKMTTPTVLFTGGENPLGNEAAEALDDALPNSRIVVFDGHGHLAMNTAPERFVDEVLASSHESA